MEISSDPYELVVSTYTRSIRQVSGTAADAIEQIHTEFGSHAALRAALIITIMKIEVQQNQWIPSISLYNYLLADYPDALPSMKYAMNCCLQAWGVPHLRPAHETKWQSLRQTSIQSA